MAELQNVPHLLDEAKRAASAGDFASADALLQDAARIQEAELGPLHPELANTVNNLAIVAEMEGRLNDAEVCYRKAVAIATASLPPDDPMVASSRKNLEDFCREHALPFDSSAAVPPVERSEQRSDRVAKDQVISEEKTPARVEVADAAALATQTAKPSFDTRPLPDSTTEAADQRPGPSAMPTRSLAGFAIGLVVLIAGVLLVMRPWSSRESPATTADSEAARPQAAQPAPPPAVPAPAPIEQPKPPAVASRSGTPVVAGAGRSSATQPTPTAGLTLVTSELCRTLSFGNNWRCDPAGQSVAPGPIVLYTRVKSSRDAIVIHQWYRGDALRKSARLSIHANTTDGYRTYSRQTVKSGEAWRVEVRNTNGDLLYQQRVSVH